MKYIKKNAPPPELIAYRKTANATYSGLKKRKSLYKKTKKSLTAEQGFICCYCGQRIKGEKDTQIEHLYAKGTPSYSEMQLDYESNLLACCDGGKSERKKGNIRKEDIYCEAAKGNIVLPVNPLSIECEEKFLFAEDGEILGVDKASEVTIKILNLNSPVIKNRRKYAIDNYLLYPPKSWEEELCRLKKKNTAGEYEEFSFALEKYIEVFCI